MPSGTHVSEAACPLDEMLQPGTSSEMTIDRERGAVTFTYLVLREGGAVAVERKETWRIAESIYR